MTEPDEAADDPTDEQARDSDANSPQEKVSTPTGTNGEEAEHDPDLTPNGAVDSGMSPPVNPDDGLPEWEPLTPELVEDEAIRGDFMLRWAVILLALLMGCTIVQETAVLTHIRSGAAAAEGSFLPTGRDTLASTTVRQRWIHLAWLFDLVLAGVYGVLGATGLSIIKALVAFSIFWVIARINVPDVSTWWGSVCSALALVAVFPALTATPAIVTLLGMALLLSLLFRAQQSPRGGFAWQIVVLIIVWNQLDDRAWMGMAVLLAFAIGHHFDRPKSTESNSSADSSLMMEAFVSFAAMLVHPFLWESWLSPLGLYQIEYPARQMYAIAGEGYDYLDFPMWSNRFWSMTYYNGAGLLLWGVTVVVFVLNAARLRVSHLSTFIVTTVLAAAGGAELAVASIVNAVLATWNAQEYYKVTFRQSYSVETSELLFSRGGRALTVIALFGLGFMMVAGHLTGADGRRVGVGFDPRLIETIESYEQVLVDSVDDRPFNFRPSQGDVLNWVGKHPFVDSRLRLFGRGAPSILERHHAVRSALRRPRDGSSQPREVYREAFDKYEINQVLPRLSGRNPDYVTFQDLLVNTDWQLVEIGSHTAAFCRTDVGDPEVTAYLSRRGQFSPVESQMRTRETDVVIPETQADWPRSPTFYSKYFYQPPPVSVAPFQEARHHLAIAERSLAADQMTASAYAAVRDIHKGRSETADDRLSYVLLGQAYGMLWGVERNAMESRGISYPGAMRFGQMTAAFHNALVCDPDDVISHFQLFRTYAEQQRGDLAFRHLNEVQRITGNLTLLPESHENFAQEQQQLEEFLLALREQVAKVRADRDADLAAGIDPQRLAQSLSQQGYTLTALEVIETDLTQLSGKPEMAVFYARLLMEAGRLQEAYDQFQALRPVADQGQLADWATFAAISELTAGDLRGSLRTLASEADKLVTSSTFLMLQPNPLNVSGPVTENLEADPLVPVGRQLQMANVYFDQMLPRLEANRLQQALVFLELGMNGDAERMMRLIVENNPVSPLRPMVEFYLPMLQADAQLPEVPQDPNVIDDLTANPEGETDEAGDAQKSEADPPATSPGDQSTPEPDSPETGSEN